MTTLLLAALALAHSPTAHPSDGESVGWTRFRGPTGDSVLTERTFPGEWGPGKNIAWSVDVPGAGWSSPIVVGERIFLTSAVGPNDDGPRGMREGTSDPSTFGGGAAPPESLTFRLSCLSLENGAELWSTDVGERAPQYSVHRSNTFATETPATDGQRVFVTYGALGELVAFDLEGEELWRVETGVYKTGNNFGWGISLVTHDGLVFLQNDNEENSFLAAFDAESGEEIWRAERREGSSWGTPVIHANGDRTSLIAAGPDTVIAYEAKTGKEHWRVQGIGGSFSSSPTVASGHVYFGNSGPMSRGPLLAVPTKSEGVIDLKDDEPAIAWNESRSGPGFASPVVHDGLVYVLGSSNILACHDAATGERIYRERIPDGAQVVATPWVAGDELFVMDETGTTVVIHTGPTFEVLRTNVLEGLYWGTPSVAGKSLLLREAKQLHCIRE